MSVTFEKKYTARYITKNEQGEPREYVVIVPDQVGENQKKWCGKGFLTLEGDLVFLDGAGYDLHGSGTGDMVVVDHF